MVVTSTIYLRYPMAGQIPRDHELLPIWNQFNANPPSTYSTEKINTEATTLQGLNLATNTFRAKLISWEQVPAKRPGAWYDSVYAACPYTDIGDDGE